MEAGQAGKIGDPRGMAEEMVEGDRLPGWRAVWKVLADGILHVEAPLMLQDQHRRGGEGFGQRAQAEAGLGGIGQTLLAVCQAKALAEQDGPGAGNQRCSGKIQRKSNG